MLSTECITQATILEGYTWGKLIDPTHYNFERIGLLKHVSDTGVMISFHPGMCGRVGVLDVEPVKDEEVPEMVKNVHFYREDA